jgi:hypothetical protein
VIGGEETTNDLSFNIGGCIKICSRLENTGVMTAGQHLEFFIKLKQHVVGALLILPTWGGPAGTRPKRGSEYSWRSLEIFSIYLAFIAKSFHSAQPIPVSDMMCSP